MRFSCSGAQWPDRSYCTVIRGRSTRHSSRPTRTAALLRGQPHRSNSTHLTAEVSFGRFPPKKRRARPSRLRGMPSNCRRGFVRERSQRSRKAERETIETYKNARRPNGLPLSSSLPPSSSLPSSSKSSTSPTSSHLPSLPPTFPFTSLPLSRREASGLQPAQSP
jgi:hypothetical protein